MVWPPPFLWVYCPGSFSKKASQIQPEGRKLCNRSLEKGGCAWWSNSGKEVELLSLLRKVHLFPLPTNFFSLSSALFFPLCILLRAAISPSPSYHQCPGDPCPLKSNCEVIIMVSTRGHGAVLHTLCSGLLYLEADVIIPILCMRNQRLRKVCLP